MISAIDLNFASEKKNPDDWLLQASPCWFFKSEVMFLETRSSIKGLLVWLRNYRDTPTHLAENWIENKFRISSQAHKKQASFYLNGKEAPSLRTSPLLAFRRESRFKALASLFGPWTFVHFFIQSDGGCVYCVHVQVFRTAEKTWRHDLWSSPGGKWCNRCPAWDGLYPDPRVDLAPQRAPDWLVDCARTHKTNAGSQLCKL